jgi:hypothetical protein
MLYYCIMNKILSCFLICWICFTGLLAEKNPATIFVNENGSPNALLIELLQADDLYDPHDDLQTIVKKTQEKWIAVRQGVNQKERCDLIDTSKQVAIRDKIISIATRMGLFDAVKPSYKHYEYGVCLGAFLDGVRARLFELVQAWESGIHFDSLVFLTGERTLRKGLGEPDDFRELCNPALSPLPFRADWVNPNEGEVKYETETDMIRLVWEQVALPPDMEEALKGRVFFVDAPKGKAARPSTADTYRVWKELFHPPAGKILAPNYPVIWPYQQLTGMEIMGPGFTFDAFVRPVSKKDLDIYGIGLISLIFDTTAKSLYEINLILGKYNKILIE